MGRWLGARCVVAVGAGGLLSSGALPAGAQSPVPVGAESQVNTYTTYHQNYPSVATDADGDFVVVWTSYGSSGSDSSGDSIQGQRYDSAGSPVGSQFQCNTYTTLNQRVPSVAAAGDGDFVVVWQGQGLGSDSSGYGIQGQRYYGAGGAAGGQFQVNTYTTLNQRVPSVSAEGDGNFVVVWQSLGSSGSDTSDDSVQGQRYDSAGSAVGSQFQVNSYTTNYQRLPSVSAEGDGDFVVVWQSLGSSGSDSSGESIQLQRYTAAPEVPSLSPAGFAAGALLLLLAAGTALRRRS